MTAQESTAKPNMQKIVVLGATSGIAVEVQRQLAHLGCKLLLVARSPQRLAELQADRRNLFRTVGQHVFQAIQELEENSLGRARKASDCRDR